jgi:hypothetical protein
MQGRGGVQIHWTEDEDEDRYTEGERNVVDKITNASGVCQLCFVFPSQSNVRSRVRGHFIDLVSRKCFGLMAIETEHPHADAHCCCCQGDDKPTWYKLTILNFETGKEFVELVSKKGGDYARVLGDHFEFTTNDLRTDEAAREFLTKAPGFGLKGLESEFETTLCIGPAQLKNIHFTETIGNSQFEIKKVAEPGPEHHRPPTQLGSEQTTHHRHISGYHACCGGEHTVASGGSSTSSASFASTSTSTAMTFDWVKKKAKPNENVDMLQQGNTNKGKEKEKERIGNENYTAGEKEDENVEGEQSGVVVQMDVVVSEMTSTTRTMSDQARTGGGGWIPTRKGRGLQSPEEEYAT